MAPVIVCVVLIPTPSEVASVEPLDDGARPPVADVLDALDGVGLRGVGRVDGQHLLQQPRPAAEFFRHADEVLEEPLFAGNQAKTSHVTSRRGAM